MPGKTLIPDAAALHLEGLRTDDDAITVVVTTIGTAPVPPSRPSRRRLRRGRRRSPAARGVGRAAILPRRHAP